MAKPEWDEPVELAEQTWAYFMRGMRTLWKLLGAERKNLTRVVCWGFGIRALALLTPLFMKLIFDEMHTRPPEQLLNRTVWYLVGGLVVGQVISLVLHHFYKERRFLASAIKLENWWPVQAQAKLLELSMGYHERENTGKKISKINKGVDRLVEIMAQLFWDFLPQVFYLVINIMVICVMDWRIGLMFCVPFIPAGWINLQLYRRYYHDWDIWEKQKEVSQGY
ncbi:MAG: ABC transporter transmembrane domain-containing protein, partial [Patescibacteria group bacterium]